jgi:predicted acetyltransferase
VGIEIRRPEDHELRAAMEAAENAFGGSVDEEEWLRESQSLPAARAVAAFDGPRPVGLAGAYQFELTIPGGQLPCAGVTWVGVLPSHRRRGILRDLMRRQLDEARASREPLAALWASESAIYGRFGYGLAVPAISMKAQRSRFALRDDGGPEGSVRLVTFAEAYELFPPVYERIRAVRAGMLTRSEHWWKQHRLADPESWRRGSSQKFYAALEVDGAVEGYAVYRIKSEWEDGMPRGEVRVIEAFGTSARAERELWRFLFGIDLTLRIDSYYLDPASSLLLNVRDPRGLGLRLTDGLWLRFVDLDAALRARSYRAAEPLVLEVSDSFCPWNAGCYRVGEGAGRTQDEADLALDVADLAAAYLGGFDFHRLVHAGRATELRPGAAEAAALLFRTELPPYCPEEF